ncbi:MAG: hypothetical protein V7K40_34240 [Nostoc sp.]|uniref:hypothetical protein n=1 Tax=Nostoc sp. TaxID=1180 RepID=UPI002FF99A24
MNRQVALSREAPPTRSVSLKKSAKEKKKFSHIIYDCYISIYVTVSTDRTDFIATNDLSQNSTDVVQKVCKVRWHIEEFHRELKQLTGIESCQCRKGCIQRNHIACAILVWLRLKDLTYQTGQTIYQIQHGLLSNYLVQQLKRPAVPMFIV